MRHRAIVASHFIEFKLMAPAAPISLVARTTRLEVEYTYTAADPEDVGAVDQYRATSVKLIENLLLHAADRSMVLLILAGTEMIDKMDPRNLEQLEEGLPRP